MTRPVPSASDKLAESADGTVGMGGTLGVDSTIEIATSPQGKLLGRPRAAQRVDHRLFRAVVCGEPDQCACLARLQSGVAADARRRASRRRYELTYSGELPRDVAASLGRVVMGFLIAAFLGVSLGTLIGRSRNMERLLEPALELLRPIPPLAFLPMFVLWFGIGKSSKVAFITYSAFFPIFTTTTDGIKFVDILLIRAAQTLGASEREIFRMVVLPAAMPSIITGLRVGFAQCLFVIVAAEFIAADSGLGYLINDSRSFFLMSNMLVGAAAIGLLGFVFNSLLRRLESRLLRWREDARGPG